MDDLINDFIAETRDMLDALGEAVVAWEGAPDDRARLDEIFRFVHTVKGNCGFFDLPRLESLSHAAEDALAAVRAGRRVPDAALVDAVLAILDRIGLIVQAMATGDAVDSEDDSALIIALGEKKAPPRVEPVPAPDAPAPASERQKGVRSIRLSVDLLDRMMNGVSDAVLARNELARRLRDAPGDVAVEAAFERVSACIAEIRDAITRTRMQRIESLFAGLPRLVRDLSAELGKQARLEVDGGDVELDREMIEMIRDPLTHIVRNAMDHGLESAEERIASGKPAAGSLRVTARQAGNQIVIEVSDDGRGLDGDRLAAKAVAAGLVTAEEAERLSPARRHALVFEPGLSTAAEVTAISGRGVGMDVVRANIERIGGVVELDSRTGKGVRIGIRVPLTLTIIPALTVEQDGRCYAVPRSAIEEILRVRTGSVRVEELGGGRVATIRGRRVPLVSLGGLFGGDAGSAEGGTLILLKPGGAGIYALLVDGVQDHEELVVKPAAPAVMAAGLYAGTTLADDGRPILLLDPSGMAARAGIAMMGETVSERLVPDSRPAAVEGGAAALLFRGLDGTDRALRLGLVERIEDVAPSAIAFAAGKLRVALGDRIVPLAGCAAPPDTKLRILRLTDGAAEIAYGFAEVVDIVSLPASVQPAPAPGEIGGVALIGDRQVELIDPYWLFAAHADAAAATAGENSAPVCALPGDDPWMETILRPLIESLGYRVVAAGGAEPVDLAIAADAAPEPAAARRVLRLRSRPEGADDASIYRYDRAALMRALAEEAGWRRHA